MASGAKVCCGLIRPSCTVIATHDSTSVVMTSVTPAPPCSITCPEANTTFDSATAVQHSASHSRRSRVGVGANDSGQLSPLPSFVVPVRVS